MRLGRRGGRGAQPLDDEQVEKICLLVARANAGMKPENVTIADQNWAARHGSSTETGFADDSYARASAHGRGGVEYENPRFAGLHPEPNGQINLHT